MLLERMRIPPSPQEPGAGLGRNQRPPANFSQHLQNLWSAMIDHRFRSFGTTRLLVRVRLKQAFRSPDC